MMAKESIYIHNWWLSPGMLVTLRIVFFNLPTAELQLRRPSKDKYRLDRILERKASQGVKIYVIL